MLKNLLIAMAVLLAAMCPQSQAFSMSREELADIQVVDASDFRYWNDGAESKRLLVEYIESVTDEENPSFIPEEERVAVFDLDGTILCETDPTSYNYMMFLYRILDDPDYKPLPEHRLFAIELERAMREGRFTRELGERKSEINGAIFRGMPITEYEDYVRSFMSRPAINFTGMTRGESFYLPMLEVVSYLVNNDFSVNVVSGTERQMTRVIVEGVLEIDPHNVIGGEYEYLVSGHVGSNDLYYVFKKDSDVIVRGDALAKNVGVNKVSSIMREIGRQPVLAFGNSSGDSSMLNYTLSNNKRKSLSFCVLADDPDRELGGENKARPMADKCKKYGWIPISMRNDFKTIYGKGVSRKDNKEKMWRPEHPERGQKRSAN